MNQTNNKHYLIGFIAAPGTGKSSIAAGVFSYIKFKYPNVQCELILEPHKALCYTKTLPEIEHFDRLYKEHNDNLNSALSVCNLVLTDAHPMLAAIYKEQPYTKADKDILIYLSRVKEFNPLGRWHNEEESNSIDKQIRLMDNDLSIEATYENIPLIANWLVSIVSDDNRNEHNRNEHNRNEHNRNEHNRNDEKPMDSKDFAWYEHQNNQYGEIK